MHHCDMSNVLKGYCLLFSLFLYTDVGKNHTTKVIKYATWV